MITLDELVKMPRVADGDGTNPVDSVSGLIDLIKEHLAGKRKVIELGTWDGVSTAAFAHFVKEVVTIDNCPRPAMVLVHFNNVTRIHSDSVVYSREIPDRSVDGVYLDTLHTFRQVYDEILAWKNKIRVGGVICGHDYSEQFQGVVEAVNHFFGNPDKVYSDTSWVVRL